MAEAHHCDYAECPTPAVALVDNGPRAFYRFAWACPAHLAEVYPANWPGRPLRELLSDEPVPDPDGYLAERDAAFAEPYEYFVSWPYGYGGAWVANGVRWSGRG